jgi:hypothetical protein
VSSNIDNDNYNENELINLIEEEDNLNLCLNEEK